MTYGDAVGIVDLLLSVATISFALYLYFKDPLKRWRFLGYRTTIIMAIFDPATKDVLLVNHEFGGWQLIQSGLVGDDILAQLSRGIPREINVSADHFDLRFVRTLGTVRNNRTEVVKKSTIGYVSLFNSARGKGYIAAYISCNRKDVEEHMTPGFSILEAQFVPTPKVMETIFSSGYFSSHDYKRGMYAQIIDDITNYVETRTRTVERLTRKSFYQHQH